MTLKKGKGHRREQHNESRSGSHKESRKSDEATKCRHCGGAYPQEDSCAARNKKCTSCGKLNHFAKVCRTVRDCAIIIWRGGGSKISKVGLKMKLHPPELKLK